MKAKNKSTKPATPAYMSYSTYKHLDEYLDLKLRVYHEEYVIACGLVYPLKVDRYSPFAVLDKGSKNPKIKRGFREGSKLAETLYRNYTIQCRKVHEMKEELKHAFKCGAHPNVRAGGFFK